MDTEDQVCSPELAKRLKELGVKQNAIFEWVRCSTLNGWVWRLLPRDDDDRVNERVSAFTSAELGEGLPGDDTVASRKLNSSWRSILYDFRGLNHYFTQAKTEANARAEMRIYLLEKGLVKP